MTFDPLARYRLLSLPKSHQQLRQVHESSHNQRQHPWAPPRYLDHSSLSPSLWHWRASWFSSHSIASFPSWDQSGKCCPRHRPSYGLQPLQPFRHLTWRLPCLIGLGASLRCWPGFERLVLACFSDRIERWFSVSLPPYNELCLGLPLNAFFHRWFCPALILMLYELLLVCSLAFLSLPILSSFYLILKDPFTSLEYQAAHYLWIKQEPQSL